jgi:hypothetical protein
MEVDMATTRKKSRVSQNGDNRIAGVGADKVVVEETIKIIPLKKKIIRFKIVGTAAYMQHRFTAKAKEKIMKNQMAGSQSRSKKDRDPRDYDSDYEAATYVLEDGRYGIPASCFRSACISACKIVGFHMTKAKLSIFAIEDGIDRNDGKTQLIAIEGKRERDLMPARNSNGGCDIRSRPIWKKWSAIVPMWYDEGQFSASDVVNLMIRAGAQVGIGEGRPDSRESNGMGLGTFEVQLVEGDQ